MAGNRGLEHASGGPLSGYRREIGRVGGRRPRRFCGGTDAGERPRSGQVRDRISEREGAVDGQAAHGRRLAAARERHDDRGQLGVARRGGQRHGAGHPPQAAIECQLADQRGMRECVRLHLARCGQDPDRDGEVEPGPLLRQIGRGELRSMGYESGPAISLVQCRFAPCHVPPRILTTALENQSCVPLSGGH
jgi:hypothetical protein